jgi:hypothetical protein
MEVMTDVLVGRVQMSRRRLRVLARRTNGGRGIRQLFDRLSAEAARPDPGSSAQTKSPGRDAGAFIGLSGTIQSFVRKALPATAPVA